MTLYTFIRFVHVVSAMGLGGALAIEAALLVRLQRAAGTTARHDALDDFRVLRLLFPLSALPTVLSGMYLVRTAWGWHPAWIPVAFISLVLAPIAGVLPRLLRVARLQRADDTGDSRDGWLWTSFLMRMAIFTGIVFLMTVKPGLRGSLAGMGVAAAAGLIASLWVLFRASAALNVWQSLLPRVTWYALAVLVLTTIHHVYGAYIYHTPWRLHAALLSGIAAAVMIGSLRVLRRGEGIARQVAFWVFAAVTLLIPVGTIGLFEGGYNHVLKDILYFAGASPALMTRMFPPPMYELPDDAFFEITGVLQLVPAIIAGWLLYRLVRSRSYAPPSPRASVATATPAREQRA